MTGSIPIQMTLLVRDVLFVSVIEFACFSSKSLELRPNNSKGLEYTASKYLFPLLTQRRQHRHHQQVSHTYLNILKRCLAKCNPDGITQCKRNCSLGERDATQQTHGTSTLCEYPSTANTGDVVWTVLWRGLWEDSWKCSSVETEQ